MDRNLGAFTCYGIEYVFDYLGEKRIKLRIKELAEKPMGLMGISLDDFTYHDAENSYFNGKGVLWVFDLLIQWFDDIEFVQFLYESSKKYNEDNYHDGGLLKKKWYDYIELLNGMIKRNPNKGINYEINKLNPYWMEFHFFYMQLSKNINKAFKNLKEIELDLTGLYKFQKGKLTGRILLEFKTRRKPLTGQYLMYKKDFVWYNLEPKEMHDNLSIYEFTKNKNRYSLILEKDKLSARIELLKLNPYAEEYNSILQNIKLDQLWNEVVANYIENFKEISLRVKQDCLRYPNALLSNGIMWEICNYYKHGNNHQKAAEIAKLNNTYFDVWMKIDFLR